MSQNFSNTVTNDPSSILNVEIEPLKIDEATDQKETIWINEDWDEQWAIFNRQADAKTAITLKPIWLMGQGYTTDERTQVELDGIVGWGKDTFYDLLFNMEIIKRVGGDSYCEIIMDGAVLKNLKPLNPGKVRHIIDRKGTLLRYEYHQANGKWAKIAIEDMFHLCHNRLANQTHGISEIKSLTKTIEADNESFEDTRQIMHHQARPFIMWKFKSSNKAKNQAFMNDVDVMRNKGGDIGIPDDDDTISYEIVQLNPSPAIFQWRDECRNRFYRNIMMPQIVPGASGGGTESEGKVIFRAHEQIVSYMQLQLEQQIWSQLFIKIKFSPSVSVGENMATDEAKDSNNLTPQPSDTEVTPVG